MSTQTHPGHVVRDAVALPTDDAPVLAGAARHDAYPIHVVDGIEPLVETLAGALGGAAVAVITDDTVEALYGGAGLPPPRRRGRRGPPPPAPPRRRGEHPRPPGGPSG